MPATPKEAFDDILTMFRTSWEANTPAITGGTVPDVDYMLDEDRTQKSGDTTFCRVDITHTDRPKASISGAGGRRRYRPQGTATFQVFVPMALGQDTLSIGQDLATVITDTFENKRSPNGVEFYDTGVQELGRVGRYFPIVVSFTFRYDEIR